MCVTREETERDDRHVILVIVTFGRVANASDDKLTHVAPTQLVANFMYHRDTDTPLEALA